MEPTPQTPPVEPPKVVDVIPPQSNAPGQASETAQAAAAPAENIPTPTEQQQSTPKQPPKPIKTHNPALIPIAVASLVCVALIALAYLSMQQG
ncbi:MAG: hypothetical protein WBO35_05910 [Candidatus Saccharimonadales bacterium]